MREDGLRVIDFHCHFPVREPQREAQWQAVVDDIGERRAAMLKAYGKKLHDEWRAAWGFPEPEGEFRPVEEQAQRYIEQMDQFGIEKIVWVTGGGNDTLGPIVKEHPDRFIGFAHHDPFENGAADELRRCVDDYGFCGFKTLAPALDRPIADQAGWPLWEVCAELNIPALIHFGPLGAGGGVMWHENINPLALYDLAKRFPDVDFVVPHFGTGYVRELLMLCWGVGNVYVDTSGSQQWTRWASGNLDEKDLFQDFLRTIGPERIVFGTDSSWFPLGFVNAYLQKQIRECRYLGVDDDGVGRIFGGNAARLLNLDGK